MQQTRKVAASKKLAASQKIAASQKLATKIEFRKVPKVASAKLEICSIKVKV